MRVILSCDLSNPIIRSNVDLLRSSETPKTRTPPLVLTKAQHVQAIRSLLLLTSSLNSRISDS